MGTRMRLAKVGVGVWLFVAVVAALAYVLPQAMLDMFPAMIAYLIGALG